MSELTAEEKTRALLATLWQKNLPIVTERVTVLERAADAAATGALTPEARAEAMGTAHKLAGALGMFGYPRGTELARCFEQSLEQSLEGDAPLDALVLRELAAALRESLGL